ncbi:MAG: phosphoglycerate kinase [Rhodobacteraceae bacterium]|nr:phosphoglycerate kinase [Paracoccaceae bacterium]
MGWRSLDDMDLAGKRVLTRVDLNVPLDNGKVNNGKVTDNTRIVRVAPTVLDILAKGGKPILIAHFGRPGGKVRPGMSLQPLVPYLEQAFDAPVIFVADCRGPAALAATNALSNGHILLLENTRFYAGEEKNDPMLAAEMAELGEIYCNDAFSVAHRAHASTEGIAKLLPNCAGRLMQVELSALEAALGAPKCPVIAVVGGAKVSTKLALLGNLASKVDHLVIGGGMANTFLAAKGINVGKSLCEHDMTDTAAEIMTKAEATGCAILLPADVVVARAFKEGAENETVAADACPPDAMILDVGPETIAMIIKLMNGANTLIWNGPLGAFEIAPFDAGTNSAAQNAAALTKSGSLISIAGGGDTVAALNQAGVAEAFTYISTAGGAFLEWMEGKELPGIAALRHQGSHRLI